MFWLGPPKGSVHTRNRHNILERRKKSCMCIAVSMQKGLQFCAGLWRNYAPSRRTRASSFELPEHSLWHCHLEEVAGGEEGEEQWGEAITTTTRMDMEKQ